MNIASAQRIPAVGHSCIAGRKVDIVLCRTDECQPASDNGTGLIELN